MTTITTIGLDLAKKVFQVHGVDAEGKVVVARKLRRKEVLAFFAKLPPCLVGMEACGSAHYWGREIAKLGHTVKLAEVCQGLCQARQDGCRRCRGDLRGGDAAQHVVRACEGARATRFVHAAQRPLAADRSAHAADQRRARAPERAWHHRGKRPAWAR